MNARPRPLQRGDFSIFRAITTRWSDNDMFGHINNVVYYTWFDTAVTGWLVEADVLHPTTDDVIPVVVNTDCTYFESITFPEFVEIGVAVEKLGNSSVTYRLGVFRASGTSAVAQGLFTHVYVTRAAQTPVPIPPKTKTRIQDVFALKAH